VLVLVPWPIACVGPLEIVDVQHLTGAPALAKRASNAFSCAIVIFSRLRPPHGFGLSDSSRPGRRPCARGSPYSAKHPSLPQSPAASRRSRAARPSECAPHLNAMALQRQKLPTQRRSQLPNFTLGAFDNPASNQTVAGKHIVSTKHRHQIIWPIQSAPEAV
jgi:hypothetical protein